MDLDPIHLVFAAFLGLIAGVIGGLAGIGGSLVMIPGLGVIYGYDEPNRVIQHLYMASAMGVNVLVSAPAAWQHGKKGSISIPTVKLILPGMLIGMMCGVWVSDQTPGRWLFAILAAFIGLYALNNLLRAARKTVEPEAQDARTQWWLYSLIGLFTGFLGGLIGVGGGIVMVPLMQVMCRVPLKLAIGTSSAVMVVSALLGATQKILNLEKHGLEMTQALQLIAIMGPGAMVGGMLGAKLTHKLPLQGLRIAVSILLTMIAARLAFSERSHGPAKQFSIPEIKDTP
ncbi:MAG: sulfite exporter TauE/SafE family protein [Planctomycetes bacterium]|nr:sulfite exporter TauE/SafE family protein [Planctomycetota bacterium]